MLGGSDALGCAAVNVGTRTVLITLLLFVVQQTRFTPLFSVSTRRFSFASHDLEVFGWHHGGGSEDQALDDHTFEKIEPRTGPLIAQVHSPHVAKYLTLPRTAHLSPTCRRRIFVVLFTGRRKTATRLEGAPSGVPVSTKPWTPPWTPRTRGSV